MSVLIKGLNIKPCKDGFDGKGLVIVGYDDKLYAVAHEQIVPLPDDATIEPKRGKWVSRIGNGNIALIECSECHFEYPMLLAHMFRYCPACGAEMVSE